MNTSPPTAARAAPRSRTGPTTARSAMLLGLACAVWLWAGAVPAQAQNANPAARPIATQPPQGARTPVQDLVTLNFVNADLEAVTRALGQILNRQFIIDPRVRGQITLSSDRPVPPREAYWQYLAALRGLGFSVVESDGIYRVVPEADAKLQSGPVFSGAPQARGDQIITQIFRLNHENANNLVPVLRPLISPNNTINVTPGTNALIITDYAENLRRIGQIITTLDMPAATDVEVVPLQHAIAGDVAPLVQRLVDGGAGAVGGGPQGAPPTAGASGSVTVLADPRSNALVVRAANPARMSVVRSVIAQLDRPATGPAAGNVHVVYLRNADAVRLAEILRAAISGEGSVGAAPRPGGLGAAGAAGTGGALSQTADAGGATTGSGLGLGGGGPTATAAGAPITGGNIQADPASNSLIITAPEPLYRQLRAIIDQLDSRRAQVYVEALIAEVRTDRAADLGFQWQTLIGRDGNRYIGAAGTNFGSGGSNILDLTIGQAGGTIVGSPGAGFNIGLLKRFGNTYGIGALARFLESNGEANILSTPNLVTLDNEEARIVIAQNVPFVTGQFTNTGANQGQVNPFQTIERQDVGLTLRVRPQIGEGGTIKMVIYQEASSVADTAVQAGVSASNLGVVTNKRTIESTVLVEDGEIIVLGGLLQDEFSGVNDKVPGLGDVPVLGGLFRSESRTRRKTNLMVFLRPVVMRSAQQAQSLSLDRYDMIRALQVDSQPTPRRLIGISDAPVLPELPRAAPPAEAAGQPAGSGRAPAFDPFYTLP